MTKGFHKKNSKRVPAKRRYNIEKKVREHNKKLRRALKKKTRHTKPKDPGVPNSLPFKEKVLKEAVEDKRRAEEHKEFMRTQLKEKRETERDLILNRKRNIDSNDLSQLKTDAEKRDNDFNAKSNAFSAAEVKTFNKSVSNLKAYYKEFEKVIEASDVVIEVLDSRDPIGSRCPQMEEMVIRNGANKRLILLLNKVDLIPKENLQNWLKYLRNELPTVAFKASTQTQKTHLSRSKVNIFNSSDELLQSSKCLGADMLMKLLANYCRNKGIKTTITVGIVGFPNVGKSSVINSLKRSRACSVSSTPGMTKAMQEISLDKHIKLLDCPGIVFAKTDEDNEQQIAIMALRNAIKVETMSDPITPVNAILSRVKHDELMLHYRLPAFNDVNEFLSLMAKRFGKLKKGGVLDVESAARKALMDWNNGNIKYYTNPPDIHSMPTHISAEIVSEMSKEFDINEFVYEEEMKEIDDNIARKVNASRALVVPSLGFTATRVNEELEGMDCGDQSNGGVNKTSIRLREKKPKKSKDVKMKDVNELKGMQLNRDRKMSFKKMKKQRKRAAKLADKLEANVSLNDDEYDFETDFQ